MKHIKQGGKPYVFFHRELTPEQIARLPLTVLVSPDGSERWLHRATRVVINADGSFEATFTSDVQDLRVEGKIVV